MSSRHRKIEKVSTRRSSPPPRPKPPAPKPPSPAKTEQPKADGKAEATKPSTPASPAKADEKPRSTASPAAPAREVEGSSGAPASPAVAKSGKDVEKPSSAPSWKVDDGFAKSPDLKAEEKGDRGLLGKRLGHQIQDWLGGGRVQRTTPDQGKGPEAEERARRSREVEQAERARFAVPATAKPGETRGVPPVGEAVKPTEPGRIEAVKPSDPARLEVKPTERGSAAVESRKDASGGPGAVKPAEKPAEGARPAGPEGAGRPEAAKTAEASRAVEAKPEASRSAEESSAEAEAAARAAAAYRESQTLGTRIGGAMASALGLDPKAARQAAADHVDRPVEPGGTKEGAAASQAVRPVAEAGQAGTPEKKPEARSEAVKPAEGKSPAAEAVQPTEGKTAAAEAGKPGEGQKPEAEAGKDGKTPAADKASPSEAKPDKPKESYRQSETLGSEIGAAMAAALGLNPAASSKGERPSEASSVQAPGTGPKPAAAAAKDAPAALDAKVVPAAGEAKSVPAAGEAKAVPPTGESKVVPPTGEPKDAPATTGEATASAAPDAKPMDPKAPEGSSKPAEEGAASGFSLSNLLSPESLITTATPLGSVGSAALGAGSALWKASGLGDSLGTWSKDFFSGIKGDLSKVGGLQTGPDGQMEFSRDAQVGRLTIPGMPSSEAQGVEGWFSGLSPRDQARWGRRLEGYPPEDRARMAMLARRIDSTGVSDPRLRADMEWKVMEDHRLDPEFDSNMIRAYQGVILTDMQNLPAVSRRHGFGEGADGRGGVTAEQMQGVPGAYNTTNNKVLYTPSVMDEGTVRDMAASRITRGHERAHHIDDRLLTERGWESNRLHYAAASGQAFQGVSAPEVRDQKQQELARILEPVSKEGEAGRVAAHAFENRAEYMATMHSLWAEGRRNPELRDQIRQFDPNTANLMTQMEQRNLQTDRQFMSTTSFDRLEQDFGISRRDLQPFRGWRNDPDQRKRLEEYLLQRVGADNAQFAIGTLLAHSHHGYHGGRGYGGHGGSSQGSGTSSGGVRPISSGGSIGSHTSGGVQPVSSGGVRPYSGGGSHASGGMRPVDSGGSAPRAGHVSPSTGYSHSAGPQWNPQSRVDPTSQLDLLKNDPLKEARDEKNAREAERAEAQKGKPQGEAPQDTVELTALDLNRDGRIELRELLEARRGGVALSADGWDAMTRLMGHLGSDPTRDSLSRVYQDATRVPPNLPAGDRSGGGRAEVRPLGPGAQAQGEADTDPRRAKEVAGAQAAAPPGAAQPTAPLAKPAAEPSQDVQLGLFREAYSVLMEGAAGKPDVKNMWLLSAIAGDRNGSHAVADAFETMLVGRKGPEQMMNLFRKVGQHTELAAAFSDTFARVAEAAPERAMGTLLLVTDNAGGRESVGGLFRDLASEPRAAVALGEMLQASTRTRGGLRGTAELLDTLSMPHNDRLTGAGELARALGDTAGWVGGSRALGKTFVNLLDAEAGGRGVATLMARMSGEPAGARATGDLLTRLGFDREGQQDLGRVLTRATGSRLGAQQFLGTLDRVASSEGGRRQVAVLFDQLSSTPMGARLLGNLAREGTGAEALGKLFDKVATSAPAGERLAWALERLGSNPRAEAEMDLFRGRAAGSERLSAAVARLAEANPGRARMAAPLAWGASEPGPAPAPGFGGGRIPEGLRAPLESGTLRLDTGRGLESARTLESGPRGVDSPRLASARVPEMADRLEAARVDLARPVEATSRLQSGRAAEPTSRGSDLAASRAAEPATRGADVAVSSGAREMSRAADLAASRPLDPAVSRGAESPRGDLGSGAARLAGTPVTADARLQGAVGIPGGRVEIAGGTEVPVPSEPRVAGEAARSGQPSSAAGAMGPGATRSAAASFLLTMTPEALVEPGPAPAPAVTGGGAVPAAGTLEPARQGAVAPAGATATETVGGSTALGRAEAVRTFAEREASAAAEPGRDLARSREIGAPGPVRTSVHRSDAERVRPVDRPQEAEAAFSRALQDEAVRVERKPSFFRPADVYSEQTLLHARICGECGFRLSPSGTCARCTVSAFYR